MYQLYYLATDQPIFQTVLISVQASAKSPAPLHLAILWPRLAIIKAGSVLLEKRGLRIPELSAAESRRARTIEHRNHKIGWIGGGGGTSYKILLGFFCYDGAEKLRALNCIIMAEARSRFSTSDSNYKF